MFADDTGEQTTGCAYKYGKYFFYITFLLSLFFSAFINNKGLKSSCFIVVWSNS